MLLLNYKWERKFENMENELLQQILMAVTDLKQGQENFENRFENLENDVRELKQGQESLKQDVISLTQDIASFDNKFNNLKQGQEDLKQDVTSLKQDVASLKQDVTDLKQDVTKIKTTLETETNKNLGLTLECVTGLIDKTSDYKEMSIKVEENDDKIKMLSNVVQGHSEKFSNLKEAL